MSQEYLNEVMRSWDVANNGDGAYQDPDDETMVIIIRGDMVVKMPKDVVEAFAHHKKVNK